MTESDGVDAGGVGLPPGWAWARLGEVCDVNPLTPLEGLPADQALAFVPMAAVEAQSNKMDVSACRTLAQVSTGFTRFMQDDVLFAKITPCMENGKTAVVPEVPGRVAFGSTEFHVLRCRPGIAPTYLQRFVVQQSFRDTARQHMSGAVGQQRVPASFMRDAPIPVPPNAEQARIVAAIEALFTDLDEAEAALSRARAGLGTYRASLLHAACTGQLTAAWRASRPPPAEDGPALLRRILAERRAAWERAEHARMQARGKPPTGEAWKARYQKPPAPDAIGLPKLPEGWTWASLEQLCAIVGGITVDAKRTGAGLASVPYLRVANVQRGRLDLSHVKMIQAPADKAAALCLLPNDVLLNEGGDRDKVGRGWVWSGELPDCIHQNHVFRARPYLPDLDGRFISHFLNEVGRAYFLDAAIQTTNLASLSMSKVSRVALPVPPPHELREIVAMIADALEAFETVDLCPPEASTLRQSILSAAFTGRLVPQDPADEPAAALLARLRAEPRPVVRARRAPVPAPCLFGSRPV